MDGRLVLGFMADLLYLKGIICYEELEAILDANSAKDLDAIFEKMYRGDFNVYKRGEPYTGYGFTGTGE